MLKRGCVNIGIIRGACFTEQIEWFGLPMAGSYGWHRPALLDNGHTG
jgi:hypothetical protein